MRSIVEILQPSPWDVLESILESIPNAAGLAKRIKVFKLGVKRDNIDRSLRLEILQSLDRLINDLRRKMKLEGKLGSMDDKEFMKLIKIQRELNRDKDFPLR